MRFLSVLTFLLAFFLNGCGDNHEPEAPVKEKIITKNIKKRVEESFLKGLTEVEINYISKLREEGGLKVATRHHEIIYEIDENNDVRGLHYELFVKFSEALKIPMKFNVVSFQDYFKFQGAVPKDMQNDNYEGHTPDILKENHIIMDSLTILPWREKLMQFVEIFPTKIVLITRRGEEISSVDQLQGKKVVTVFETSYYTKFNELNQKLNLELEYVLTKDSRKMAKMVDSGDADVTSRDANRAIIQLRSFPNLRVGMPITDSQSLAWAVAKENQTLHAILSKYVIYSRKHRIFEKLWLKYFGITFEEYLQLIDYQIQ